LKSYQVQVTGEEDEGEEETPGRYSIAYGDGGDGRRPQADWNPRHLMQVFHFIQ